MGTYSPQFSNATWIAPWWSSYCSTWFELWTTWNRTGGRTVSWWWTTQSLIGLLISSKHSSSWEYQSYSQHLIAQPCALLNFYSARSKEENFTIKIKTWQRSKSLAFETNVVFRYFKNVLNMIKERMVKMKKSMIFNFFRHTLLNTARAIAF